MKHWENPRSALGSVHSTPMGKGWDEGTERRCNTLSPWCTWMDLLCTLRFCDLHQLQNSICNEIVSFSVWINLVFGLIWLRSLRSIVSSAKSELAEDSRLSNIVAARSASHSNSCDSARALAKSQLLRRASLLIHNCIVQLSSCITISLVVYHLYISFITIDMPIIQLPFGFESPFEPMKSQAALR